MFCRFPRTVSLVVSCLVTALVAKGETSALADERLPSAARVRSISQEYPVDARVGTAPLSAIEGAVLPPAIVEGDAAYGSLPKYYWAENKSLLARLERIHAQQNAQPTSPVRALTLVAGPAGIGKTFFKSQVIDTLGASKQVCKIDLRELYTQWGTDGRAAAQPNLADGDCVLNCMLRVVDGRKPHLADYLDSHGADCYVIDSLDEVHTHDASLILRQIQQFIEQSPRDFLHIVVFGRGSAFRDYWAQRQNSARTNDTVSRGNEDAACDTELFVLNPPRFRTTGDLLVSSWNYCTWAHQLKWSPNAAGAEPMPLAEFKHWSSVDFSRAGRFSTVQYEPAHAEIAGPHQTLLSWARQQRVVCGTLGNLAGNGIMRDLAAANTAKPYDERRLMRAYLQAWLERESGIDQQASQTRPDCADLYQRVLEQTAVHTLLHGGIRDDGFFNVPPTAMVALVADGHLYHFRVTDVLDHSGLTWNDPCAGNEQPLYRFEPIWFHRLLVDMHNDRVD